MVRSELKLCVGMFLTLLCTTSLHPQEPYSPDDAQELVREVVANELQALQTDRSRWRFVSRAQQPGIDQTKDVIETNEGALTRLIAERGEPLTPEQQRNQDQRLDQFIRNPSQMKRQKQEQERDKQRLQKLLAWLPEGFLYQHNWDEGGNVGLGFRPNPGFRPPNRDAQVFHAMEGTMIVDGSAKRIKEFRGQLGRDVVFGWGILGRLHRGGVFEVRQDEVAAGHWELTLLDIQITGKALFFKTVGQQQHEARSDFHEVPVDLTPAEAVEMLKQKCPHAGRRRTPACAVCAEVEC
jgi:hypothetical protein